jgi:hypothetical protein
VYDGSELKLAVAVTVKRIREIRRETVVTGADNAAVTHKNATAFRRGVL